MPVSEIHRAGFSLFDNLLCISCVICKRIIVVMYAAADLSVQHTISIQDEDVSIPYKCIIISQCKSCSEISGDMFLLQDETINFIRESDSYKHITRIYGYDILFKENAENRMEYTYIHPTEIPDYINAVSKEIIDPALFPVISIIDGEDILEYNDNIF